MSNPNRAMAYVPKGESAYTTFPESEREKASRCAEYFRSNGYKVRESRFKMGPRNKPVWMLRVSVYFDGATQAAPDPMAWKFAN